ncbi:MAG: rhomboid family intramembrane serine protease [Kofleriaceae bacterium]
MYYELALISVLIAAGYWGLYFVRMPQTRTYGLMQLAACILSGIGLYHRRVGGADWGGIAGAIGVGTGACVLVLGPLVRAAARRFVGAERFKIAERLVDIADILAPGSGHGDEKQLIAAMREIRDGNIEQTVDALTAAREQTRHSEARLAIDERIAMLYLAAYRWDDAIAYAEKNLFGVQLEPSDSVITPMPTADGKPAMRIERGSPPNSLRRVLGVAPPVWVELLGAYGYKGDLDRAAQMLARLEEVCAGRDDAAIWVHRGRMIFLALAGRVAAVQTLVAPAKSKHMSRGARAYWVAVAHERGGDARGATAAYTKARSQSRGRPRVLIDQALARLATRGHDGAKLDGAKLDGANPDGANPDGAKRDLVDLNAHVTVHRDHPIELTPLASELVAQVEAAPAPIVAIRERTPKPWATRVLTTSMFASAIAITLLVGDTSDLGVLVRSGAMVRGFIANGEWWRIISCNFIHVGGLHLLVNTLGLWFLGKLCEEMFGSIRTGAIFAISGVGAFIASDLASPVGVSAGASGAIFGLLGAIFVELTIHKQHHRAAWSRGMWGSIVVVALGQFGLDVFMYSGITDQYAHLGGAAVGALCGAVFSPHAKFRGIATQLARVTVVAFTALVIFAVVMIVRTPIAQSLGTPDHAIAIGPVTAHVPNGWTYDGAPNDETLHDPDDMIELRFVAAGTNVSFDDFVTAEEARLHKRFERVDIATESLVPLPPSWQGKELAVSAEEADAVGGREHYLLVMASRPINNGTLLVSIEVAETMAKAAPTFFTSLLGSIE